MILKSITLSGFKSFAKKTTIDVSQSVTGIVGPNGSGKSNIAESIRFVLGEQSMKSIRSKSLGDLVFKGSSAIHALGRASVSLTIDNSKKVYNDNVALEVSKFLAYDEIVLSREVFVDGGSTYKINDAEVRLKDVQSLLSLAGIGASVHTIISQGEADKILLASPKERKEMIEDALGLRIHQIRLRESERKLLKVKEHMNTTELLRREIAPELRHLSSLMTKLGKVEDERVTLLENYKKYFKYENEAIKDLKAKLGNVTELNTKASDMKLQLENLNKKEAEINSAVSNVDEKAKLNQEKSEKQEERFVIEREISNILYEKKNILSKINDEIKTLSIDKGVFVNFKENISTNLDSVKKLLNQGDIVTAHNIIDSTKNILITSNSWHSESINKEELNSQISNLENKENELNAKISNIKTNILEIDERIEKLNSGKIIDLQNIYREKSEAERVLRDIENKISSEAYHRSNLENKENDFIFATTEAQKFVGHDAMNYGFVDMTSYDHVQNMRAIERSKIRIEEVGIINGGEIKNNFEEMSDRDKFLATEIEDLTKSQEALNTLVESLVTTIDNDFKKGVEKINFTFSNFFHDVFPGGRAKLFNVETVDEENGVETVSGIDIEVSLPDKKVKDLNMLSGGEKTLCSIALLFALTSITPPPFMVLDETDAALDEMNAKKYGKLLQKLSEKSRLLVITHNRETMNECDILYGVTMGFDGCSKMLSIKFDK
jgi:chromosome segregation protein